MNERKTAQINLESSRMADEAIAEFLQAVELGQAPNRSDFVREHDNVRSELNSFFDAYEQMNGSSTARTFEPGKKLGRHKLVRPIGTGTFGTVWLGFDSKLKRPVAIKVPTADRFSSQSQRNLFLLEAQTVAQLEHANIVPIYDVGETDSGEVYLVSRLIAGNDLATECRNQKFSFREVANCLAAIASALDYAHRRNIIHRDVKPSNILIDSTTKQPYITDFGLACMANSVTDESIVGTPAYMSPEQTAGNPLDHRSDEFSLGVVLFELLYGSRPFVGNDATTLLKSIREQPPQFPSSSSPPVPSALAAICLKSLSKVRNDRYDSLREMERELRAFVGENLASPTVSVRGVDSPKNGALIRKASIYASIALLLLSSWFGATWLYGTAPKDRDPATRNTEVRIHFDHELAKTTIELGGRIDFRFAGKDHEVDSLEEIPTGDISLQWVMFDNYQKIDDSYFAQLHSINTLEGVDFSTCDFSSTAFSLLSKIESLKVVHASDTAVSDEAIASLAALSRLRQLTLTGTKISNKAMRDFNGNKTLKVLRLASTNITDVGLQDIATISNLEELNLISCNISDEGVKHLSRLRNLRVIKMTETFVTDRVFEHLVSSSLRRIVVPSAVLKSDSEMIFKAKNPDCKIVCE